MCIQCIAGLETTFFFFSGEKAEKTAEKMLDWVGFVETWRLWRSGSVAITFCLSKA